MANFDLDPWLYRFLTIMPPEEDASKLVTYTTATDTTASMDGLAARSEKMAAFYRSISVKRPPDNKVWQKVYHNFNDLNAEETAEELISEALAEVLPAVNFNGVLTITVSYSPSLNDECTHGYTEWWVHCPHCAEMSTRSYK